MNSKIEPRAPHQKKWLRKFEDAGSETSEQSGKQRADRLKRIAALLGQLRRLEQQPAADVKDDKARDKGRVAKYAGAHFRLHRSILGKCEILRLNQQTANHHADHAGQHTGGEQIAGDIERIPETAARMDTEEAFENIDKVNQEVKNKTVEDHRVEQRHHRPFLEHALLGQDNPQGTANAVGEIVEARIRLAPGDRPVNVVKSCCRRSRASRRRAEQTKSFQVSSTSRCRPPSVSILT